jgi:hypothetical protein
MPSNPPFVRAALGTAAAAALLLLAGCNTTPPITTTSIAPPLLGVATFQWTRGTVNAGAGGPVASCTPPTPPSPAFPASPVPGEVLVGEQDWRNTVADANGAVCGQSRATRWQGLAVFDMAGVAANLATGPARLLTARLDYRVGSFLKIPASAQDIDLCVRALQLATGYETPRPFALVVLDPQLGGFPQSAPSRLGATLLPSRVPLGQPTTVGPATVNPAPPAPAVSVDVSLLLSDWAESLATLPASSAERGRFGIAFLPFGPTIQQLGLTSNPPTPVPLNRATARCTSILKDMALTVSIGR